MSGGAAAAAGRGVDAGAGTSPSLRRDHLLCETQLQITRRDKAKRRRPQHWVFSSGAYWLASGRLAKRGREDRREAGGKVLHESTRTQPRTRTTARHTRAFCHLHGRRPRRPPGTTAAGCSYRGAKVSLNRRKLLSLHHCDDKL